VQAIRRKRAKPKKPAQKTKMSKEQRPWKFKNRTQTGKNNKCTCFSSRQ
jgi:mannose-6-phosphate isomerase-like protein (cupin superfamily)